MIVVNTGGQQIIGFILDNLDKLIDKSGFINSPIGKSCCCCSLFWYRFLFQLLVSMFRIKLVGFLDEMLKTNSLSITYILYTCEALYFRVMKVFLVVNVILESSFFSNPQPHWIVPLYKEAIRSVTKPKSLNRSPPGALRLLLTTGFTPVFVGLSPQEHNSQQGEKEHNKYIFFHSSSSSSFSSLCTCQIRAFLTLHIQYTQYIFFSSS